VRRTTGTLPGPAGYLHRASKRHNEFSAGRPRPRRPVVERHPRTGL